MQYLCWGDDKEDLTAKVEAALSDYEPFFGVMSLRRNRDSEKIVVACSHGHQNVFEVPRGLVRRHDE